MKKILLSGLALSLTIINLSARDIDAIQYFNTSNNSSIFIMPSEDDTIVFNAKNNYYTNGREVAIVASKIKLIGDVKINSFQPNDIPAPIEGVAQSGGTGGVGGTGKKGTDGKNAQTFRLMVGELIGNGTLTINNSGQIGGKGQNGGVGGQGARGSNGRNAECKGTTSFPYVGCRGSNHGASRGGNGGRGGDGGKGGNGGNGGNGGDIKYKNNLEKYIDSKKLNLISFGGLGVIGGNGGQAGTGGSGGSGGHGDKSSRGCVCGYGGKPSGSTGARGNNGAIGSKGKRGNDGKINSVN